VQALTAEGLRPDLFWYNPNIHLYMEYRARRDSLISFAEKEELLLVIEDEYGLRLFIKGVEEGAEPAAAGGRHRCAFCYRLRIEKAARTAAEKAYHAFSSTLLISPYQDHELLKRTGEEMAAKYGVEFLYRDFRSLFRSGQNQARAAGYYMQKYCGCIYSEEERYLK